MTRAVITFHSIDDQQSVLSYPPAALHNFLGALRRAQVPIVSYDKLLQMSHGVTLTFDDGFRSVLEHALPILRSFDAPAHLFVVSDFVGRDNRWPTQPARAQTYPLLDWDELATCQAAGITIESHTATHPDLTRSSASAVHEELELANTTIERRLGRRPKLFAYPYGFHNGQVETIVSMVYNAAFTTRLAYLPTAGKQAAVPRLDSYYLRSALWQKRPLGALTQCYLSARALLRRLRGSE